MSRDLDLFTSNGSLRAARDALIAEASRRGWAVDEVQTGDQFLRMVIRVEGDEVLMDLGVDGPPLRPAVRTTIGYTYDPEELAGQKTLALFGRATERDFIDVFVLAQRFGRDLLLARAAEIDPGFDRLIFAEMLAGLERFDDDELPTEEPDALRAYFADWARAIVNADGR